MYYRPIPFLDQVEKGGEHKRNNGHQYGANDQLCPLKR